MQTWEHLKSRAIRTLQAVIQDLKRPPPFPPGHYYSPIPSDQDIERSQLAKPTLTELPMNFEEQVAFARILKFEVPPLGRWAPGNNMYNAADSSILRSMLLHARPQRFVEVGSGHSTALVLDIAERELPDLKITCIEPFADRLRSVLRDRDLERLTLIEKPVQSVAPEVLAGMVQAGDILFIDSSHVAKAGSDVCHLVLYTLPLLPVGAIVHVHDIFWPFEYPEDWLRRGRAWTEAYLLHAFLTHNSDWRVRLFSSWLWQEHRELIPNGAEGLRAGSLWLERVA